MQRFGQAQLGNILARAAFGCALVVLLWPAAASAGTFDAGTFSVGVSRCMDASVSDMAEQGVSTFMVASSRADAWTPAAGVSNGDPANTDPANGDATNGDATNGDATNGDTTSGDETLSETDDSIAETPCTTNSDADPSSNFCFEDAEGQISTLPRLLAQWRGEQAAGGIIDSMMAATEPVDREQVDGEPTVRVAAASIEVEPEAPEGESCRNNPDECRALPPLPPTLTVDVSAPAASRSLLEFDIPSRISEDDTRAWADLRVGPQLGHRTLPDQPPRG